MKDRGRKLYVFAVICLIYWPRNVFCLKYPSVFWTPANCRFNLNKQEADSAYEFLVKPMSAIFFVCPHIALSSDLSNDGFRLGRMYENLWVVDKDGYDTCTVNTTRDREILRCDGDPRQLRYLKESFSPVRAFDDRMKYKSGKTYYFISTSSGTKKSLDNLSGGHCKTHHMKLKITVCYENGSCAFNMPKCPYSDVFHDKSTTATSTTSAQKQMAKINSTSLLNNGTKIGKDIYTIRTPTPLSHEKTKTALKELPALHNHQTSTTITEDPSQSIAVKHSSEDTFWGTQRKHIIIHITMALFILILSLCLVYILLTRRKQKKSSPPAGIDSKLYQERPTSITSIHLNDVPNGNTSTPPTAYHV